MPTRRRPGLDIPIHVDAAVAAFLAPSCSRIFFGTFVGQGPFRSNASGQQVRPGSNLGLAGSYGERLEDLLSRWSFWVNYLGGKHA